MKYTDISGAALEMFGERRRRMPTLLQISGRESSWQPLQNEMGREEHWLIVILVRVRGCSPVWMISIMRMRKVLMCRDRDRRHNA
jgi:hypothetical protein